MGASSSVTARASTAAALGAPSAPDLSSGGGAPASEAITGLFGATLKGKNKADVATSDALAGKVVGIYFSAHWCPPCRGFTPKLAEAYTKYVAAGKNFEIVFVSSDKNEPAFDEYFGEMPWLALPFADRERKEALNKKYKVRGIPSLVIVDEDGSTITTDGRSAVMEDEEGAKFPWRPTPLAELLKGDFVAKDGSAVPAASLASKHLAIYFSAHWCPPCRGFTPQLAAFYKDFTASRSAELEIVFASSDKDEAAFNDYYNEMPWLALPFAERERKEALSKHFDVSGIPTLVVLGPAAADGSRPVITTSARGSVGADPKGAEFPWHPKPCEELSATCECNGSDINESPALVLLMERADDAAKAALGAAMQRVAAERADADKAAGAEPSMIFFTAASGDGVVGRVRELTKLGEAAAEPALLLLDIPDNGGFYVRDAQQAGGGVDEAAIRAFVAQYKGGELASQRQQLG